MNPVYGEDYDGGESELREMNPDYVYATPEDDITVTDYNDEYYSK